MRIFRVNSVCFWSAGKFISEENLWSRVQDRINRGVHRIDDN